MPVDIWGDGPLADAALVAARSLGWDAAAGSANVQSDRDVVAVAPLARSVAECDALIAGPTPGRRAFAWPMVSVTAVQQMIGRCRGLGSLTNLSSRSTQPSTARTPDLTESLLSAVHDQVAVLLLLAQISGSGSPTRVSLRSSPQGVERIDMRMRDLTATVEVKWTDAFAPSLDVQAAGADGVLRIETDPSTHLEHNGEPVPIPTPRPISPELQPLRDAGIIDTMKTIGASFFDDRPLAHAFSFEFGRSVVAVIEAAGRSGRIDGSSVPLEPLLG